IPISLVRECIRELLRQTVRVDNERFGAEVDQMIERKSDERFLENRHERLGQMVSQRTEPGSKPRAQNECLRDCGHHVVAALVTSAEFTKLRLTQPPLHAKDSPMAEETVWRGTSSQWKNFGLYILCALFCWLIVPIFIALARYLHTKHKVHDLTTERLKITQGYFSKVTDTLEL